MDLKPGDNKDGWHIATCNRADIQKMLLKNLLLHAKTDGVNKLLKCGVAVESYEEVESDGKVIVNLSDGSSIDGKLLLGCDGINSKIREHLHGGDSNDPLGFLNVIFYWAKCTWFRTRN